MTPDETYETPFDTNTELAADDLAAGNEFESVESIDTEAQADVDQARSAWDSVGDGNLDTSYDDVETDDDDNEQLAELASPFVGQWNQLISTTNWEKGRIISQWRRALIDSDAQSHQYSDDAWARRVGGVTAPHVGRLRRVHDRFASTYQTYPGLYWSHFLAALDWDDAPLWLEGAAQSKWSVAGMREQRWQTHGAIESKRPTASEVIEVDTDEDVVLPAQGGGRTKEYGDEPATASGPRYEDPDFGEDEELQSLAGSGAPGSSMTEVNDSDAASPIQPFAGLPELPDDLADAIEMIKLAVLRHKTDGWGKVDPDTVAKYLEAIAVLIRS